MIDKKRGAFHYIAHHLTISAKITFYERFEENFRYL